MTIQKITALSNNYANKIAKQTSFLTERFGISYFTFQKVTHDGQWSLLTNSPSWHEYSADNKYYLHDPTLGPHQKYRSGVCLTSAHEHEDTVMVLSDVRDRFKLDHCLAIVTKKPEYCEFAFFAAPVENKKVINTYITQLDQLRQFVNFFKLENNKLLAKLEDDQINLNSIIPNFKNRDNVLEIAPTQADTTLVFDNLTIREQECLYHFLRGKTARETGAALNLSPRTVEDYITRLKIKLGCDNKRDLHKVFPRDIF